jgi:hypothetical protein
MVKAREACDGDGPLYGWVYNRIISGAVPAEKIGGSWHLSPEGVEALVRLWKGRPRRVAPPPAAS